MSEQDVRDIAECYLDSLHDGNAKPIDDVVSWYPDISGPLRQRLLFVKLLYDSKSK